MATSVITSRHRNHHRVPTGVIAGVVVTLAAFVGYFTLQNDQQVVRQSTPASSSYAGPTSALTGLIPSTATSNVEVGPQAQTWNAGSSADVASATGSLAPTGRIR